MGGLIVRRTGPPDGHRPDVAIGVEFFKSVVFGEWLVQRVGELSGALGPFTDNSQVGGHGLEDQHQGGLDEAHHAAKAAVDVLGARVAQVAKGALDEGAAPAWLVPVIPIGVPLELDVSERLRSCRGLRVGAQRV